MSRASGTKALGDRSSHKKKFPTGKAPLRRLRPHIRPRRCFAEHNVEFLQQQEPGVLRPAQAAQTLPYRKTLLLPRRLGPPTT